MDEHARLVPGPRRILEAGRARHLGAQAARCEVPERQRVRRRRCGLHHGPHPQGAEQPEQFRRLHQAGGEHRGGRSEHTIRLHTNGVFPLLPTYLAQFFIINRKTDEGMTTEDFNSGKAAIGTGPFRFVSYQAGRPRRAGAQRQLLGTEAGLAARRLSLHRQRRLAHRGAAGRRCRFHRLRADRGSGRSCARIRR